MHEEKSETYQNHRTWHELGYFSNIEAFDKKAVSVEVVKTYFKFIIKYILVNIQSFFDFYLEFNTCSEHFFQRWSVLNLFMELTFW